MRYIGFTNWKKYQHYKKADPPWIKLHRSMLDSVNYYRLTDTGRGHVLGLLLLAAKKNNRILYDPAHIKASIFAKSRIDFKKLLGGKKPLMKLYKEGDMEDMYVSDDVKIPF